MYLDEYKRWLAADLEDADLKPELAKVEGNDDEIKDRFAVALKFGTAGLRGVLGAGTNRMNIYVVRQATQGLANWVLTQGGTQTVAISYDSRLKSDVFAKTAAGVLAANGIKVRIYDALMPVPALSFATRYYNCNAGIMVTASHNPAKYNGYKAYGPDGCQMTDDAAAIVYDEIQKTDVLTGAKYISFADGVENGMIRFVGDDCKKALYDAIEARQVRPGLCKTAGLKLVYSPLNGSGLVPVTHVLNDMGITDITIVPEQEYPNGYFTTCSYPNPEIFEALKLGLELATKTGADLMLATDPDADRVGIAMKCPDGSYELVSGNEMGVLLLDYICAGRIEKGTMPKNPVAVKSIVSTPLADAVAKNYGVDQFTDEELDSIESDYNSYIESSIESFRSYVNAGESGTGEVSGDAAILGEAEKIFDEKLTECGMTRDDILMWYRNAKTADKLKAKLAEDDPVEYSDAEEQYSEIVAGIKQVYENSPADYEQDLYYKYYWLPDNARMIKHILIKFDSDDSAEITACRENNDEAGAEKAREKALENLRPRIEEIKNMLDNGADFDELAKEYSEDTGLSSNPDGYLVVPNGETYYKEFQQAAYELQNVGDYTLVGTDLGWHVVMYAADAVMTEENEKALIDAIYENMQSNAATSAYNNAMQGWRTEYAYDFDYAKLDINESDTAEAASSTASAAESSVPEQTSSAESTAA